MSEKHVYHRDNCLQFIGKKNTFEYRILPNFISIKKDTYIFISSDAVNNKSTRQVKNKHLEHETFLFECDNN